MGGSAHSPGAESAAEPTGTDAHQRTRSGAVPTASSDEPPPTSTTPSSPAGGEWSVPATPTKASRASSWSDRTLTGNPVDAWTAATSSVPLAALRMAAVATNRTRLTP